MFVAMELVKGQTHSLSPSLLDRHQIAKSGWTRTANLLSMQNQLRLFLLLLNLLPCCGQGSIRCPSSLLSPNLPVALSLQFKVSKNSRKGRTDNNFSESLLSKTLPLSRSFGGRGGVTRLDTDNNGIESGKRPSQQRIKALSLTRICRIRGIRCNCRVRWCPRMHIIRRGNLFVWQLGKLFHFEQRIIVPDKTTEEVSTT